jgi:hypothetical protein
MKRILTLAGVVLAVSTMAWAQQNSANRIVVPARNGNRPRTIEANLLHGSIAVRAGSGEDIVIEAPGLARRTGAQPRGAEGMHRIDAPLFTPLQVEEEGDTVHINLLPLGASESGLTVTVPVNTSLKINCTHGGIKVEGVHGEIDVSGIHGNIDLTNVGGTVIANTTHGYIKAGMDSVDASKPLSFVTLDGNVDVTLPADLRATLKMKTLHGDIWSDFDVKLTGGGGPISRGAAGRMHIEFDRTVTGTINGGGTEITLSTINGRILIHKK